MSGQRLFICEYDGCDKSYTSISHLKRHEEIHEGNFKCREKNCGRIFISKATLKKHLDNIHHKKKHKKYKCSHCDEEFNKRNWLAQHEFRHTGIKPYVCSVEGCEKRFSIPNKLKSHLKIHKGYTCVKENCGQTFPKWTLLRKHVKVSHPTIHRCHYCEKIFSTLYNLRSHLEIHKLDREVFPCPHPNCSRFYTLRRNLNFHIKSYHEKRPFVCTVQHCFKAFKFESDLQAHISRHDPSKCILKKKKKRNSRSSFAAKLAGISRKELQPKETKTQVTDEDLYDNTNVTDSNKKISDIYNENNSSESRNVDGIQVVLNMVKNEKYRLRTENTISRNEEILLKA